MQTSIYYYRYFLRFSIRAIYQRLDKRNAITCRIHPDKRRYWWFQLQIWKANKNIWRPSLLIIIGRWIITTITLFHGSPHSPLAYGIFGELSHPCCPSQSIFPPSAVQTLATLFATIDLLVSIVSQPFIAPYWMSLVHKEWYLCWFAYKATYITAYMHCVQCGQTFSPVVRAKIQTNSM